MNFMFTVEHGNTVLLLTSLAGAKASARQRTDYTGDTCYACVDGVRKWKSYRDDQNGDTVLERVS